MKKCINQQMTISLEDNFSCDSIGKLHGIANTYHMIDKDGDDWGLVDLCEECKDYHIKQNWICKLVK